MAPFVAVRLHFTGYCAVIRCAKAVTTRCPSVYSKKEKNSLMESIFGFISTPFGYVMRFIYEFVGSYGLSIVLFSVLAKILTMPLIVKQKKGMLDQRRIQPKVVEIQKKYGRDRNRMNQEIQDLYANEGVSPMSGCGSMLITLPIMMGLYYVVYYPLTYFMRLTETEIGNIAAKLGLSLTGESPATQQAIAGAIYENYSLVEGMSPNLIPVDMYFGPFNMAAVPDIGELSWLWLIPILSAATAFLYSQVMHRMQKKGGMTVGTEQSEKATKITFMLMPLMSGYFAFVLPAGLGVYWISSNLISTVIEIIISTRLNKKPADADMS